MDINIAITRQFSGVLFMFDVFLAYITMGINVIRKQCKYMFFYELNKTTWTCLLPRCTNYFNLLCLYEEYYD